MYNIMSVANVAIGWMIVGVAKSYKILNRFLFFKFIGTE